MLEVYNSNPKNSNNAALSGAVAVAKGISDSDGVYILRMAALTMLDKQLNSGSSDPYFLATGISWNDPNPNLDALKYNSPDCISKNMSDEDKVKALQAYGAWKSYKQRLDMMVRYYYTELKNISELPGGLSAQNIILLKNQ